MSKRETILVTGGAGFIASHIVDAYITAGYRVVVIDNLSTGSRKNLNPKAIFYKADIRDSAKLKAIFRKEKPSIINHHAAAISVVESVRNPESTYEVNVLGTMRLIEAASPYLKRFIFSSTGGALYAAAKSFPVSEIEQPSPSSPYGFSKQLAEEVVRFSARLNKFDFVILRYANVFGPRQNAHGESGVIAIFSDLARRGLQPTVYRKQTTRDYMYVADVVRANVAALVRGSNETINIGTGLEVTNQQVYEAVARAFSWREKPLYKPARPGEVLRSCLDNKKADRLLAWKPKTDLNSGLKVIYAAKS